MQDQGDQGYSDELRKKAEELKRKAFEEEAQRLEREAAERSLSFAKQQLADDAEVLQEKRQQAEEAGRREDLRMAAAEDEVQRVLDLEHQKRLEARRREEAELKRRELEEQRQEADRKAEEEASRRRGEEERHRRELEEERKRDANKKRSELESLRREQEQLRREAERRERIQSLLRAAESFFAGGDYEHAAVEVAKALVNDPAHPEILALDRRIKEAQGKGSPPVGENPHAPAAPAEAQAAPSEAPRRTGASRTMPNLSRYISYGLAASVLLLAAMTFLHFRKKFFSTQVKIVVLPWSAPSQDSTEAVIASGLAEEVARELEKVKPLTVLGFASVSNAVRMSGGPASASAFHLGYGYVLQGSFSHTGDNIFASVQLIDSTAAVLWSHQYVHSSSALSQLPREICADALGFLNTLSDEISAVQSQPSHPVATNDAYVLYLQGLARFHSRTPGGLRESHDWFIKAAGQDEHFAEPRAAAARTLLLEYERGWDTERTSIANAKALALEAVKIDPSLGAGYCSLGEVLTQEGKYDDALAQLDRASELMPRSSEVHLAQAKLYFKLGQYNELMAALARAYELDPLDLDVLTTYASMHQLTGTARMGMPYHEAALTLATDSTLYLIGPVADAALSDPALSLSYSPRVAAAFQRRLQQDSSDYTTQYRLARMLQVTGQAADATGLLMKLESRLKNRLQAAPRDAHAMMFLAKTFTRLGRFSEATILARQAAKLDPANAEVRYGIAQIYSLQMYSQKNRAIDETKKAEALRALREALARGYRLNELTSADFYNMYGQSEFRTILQERPASP